MKRKIKLKKKLFFLDREFITKLQESQIAHIRGGSLPPNQNSCYVQSCTGTGPGGTKSCNNNSCDVPE